MTIRLEPNDPEVLKYVASALSTSVGIKPRLRFRCDKCGSLLAEVGDVLGHGALFVSSWEVEARDICRVDVNGRELRPRERQRWMSDHYTISGPSESVEEPSQHGVIAVLQLPLQMAQDYPDLLMRCEKHGDYIANRLETLKRLRKGAKPVKLSVRTSMEFNDYEAPNQLPGGEQIRYEVVRRLRRSIASDPTTTDQLQARKSEQAAHIRRRRAERDTP